MPDVHLNTENNTQSLSTALLTDIETSLREVSTGGHMSWIMSVQSVHSLLFSLFLDMLRA